MSLSLSLSLSLQRNGMDQISSHRITDFIDKFVVVFRAAWWWLGVVGHDEACISSTWLVACCRSRYVMMQLACKHCLQMLENCLWFLDTFSFFKMQGPLHVLSLVSDEQNKFHFNVQLTSHRQCPQTETQNKHKMDRDGNKRRCGTASIHWQHRIMNPVWRMRSNQNSSWLLVGPFSWCVSALWRCGLSLHDPEGDIGIP